MNEEELPAVFSQTLTRAEFIDSVMNQLRARGISYGAFFEMDYLKELAGPFAKDETAFSFFKLELRKRFLSLQPVRFYLTEKGLCGAGMRVAQAVESYHLAHGFLEQADGLHERAELLLGGTDQSQLTEAERLRDANLLREIVHRRMLLRRAEEVVGIVRKHGRTILKPDIEA